MRQIFGKRCQFSSAAGSGIYYDLAPALKFSLKPERKLGTAPMYVDAVAEYETYHQKTCALEESKFLTTEIRGHRTTSGGGGKFLKCLW